MGGTTAHSYFGIPIPIDSDSVSNVKPNSEKAKLIREALIILWDEITMADKRAVECLDRLLREIMGVDAPFGGKVVVFSGDWRQLLPVVKKGSRAQVVNTTLKRSSLWTGISFTFEMHT